MFHGHTFMQGVLHLVIPGISAAAAGQGRGIAEKGCYLRGQQLEVLEGRPAPDINHTKLGEQKQPSNAVIQKDAETLHKSVTRKTVQHTF